MEISPLVHHGEHYDKLNTMTDDIPFYQELARKQGGSVLELCCGTGRITIPMAKGGINVTGLDNCQSMLTKGKEKSEKAGTTIDFIEGDIRNFNLNRKFNLILIPFNSLQCIYPFEEVEQVFCSVKNHLAIDGLFAFSVFNPSIRLMTDREKQSASVGKYNLDDGTKVSIRERCSYDAANQVNRVTWTFDIGGTEKIQRLDMRCFYPLELNALLKYNGYEVVNKYGSFTKEPFIAESQHQIYVCRAVK